MRLVDSRAATVLGILVILDFLLLSTTHSPLKSYLKFWEVCVFTAIEFEFNKRSKTISLDRIEVLILWYKLIKLGLLTEAMKLDSIQDLTPDILCYQISALWKVLEGSIIKVTEGSLSESPSKKKSKPKEAKYSEQELHDLSSLLDRIEGELI